MLAEDTRFLGQRQRILHLWCSQEATWFPWVPFASASHGADIVWAHLGDMQQWVCISAKEHWSWGNHLFTASSNQAFPVLERGITWLLKILAISTTLRNNPGRKWSGPLFSAYATRHGRWETHGVVPPDRWTMSYSPIRENPFYSFLWNLNLEEYHVSVPAAAL